MSAGGSCSKKSACQAGQCEKAGKAEGQACKPAARAEGCSSSSICNCPPPANTPSCELQQPTQAARAAPSTAAIISSGNRCASTASGYHFVPACNNSCIPCPPKGDSFPSDYPPGNPVNKQEEEAEIPSDSYPPTPEDGSFPLLSQLDGADLDLQSLTPPTPEPGPLDRKKLSDCESWSTVRPSRRNPR